MHKYKIHPEGCNQPTDLSSPLHPKRKTKQPPKKSIRASIMLKKSSGNESLVLFQCNVFHLWPLLHMSDCYEDRLLWISLNDSGNLNISIQLSIFLIFWRGFWWLGRMFWLLPFSSHFVQAMEVAVKGKSPSYLHLFQRWHQWDWW